jgi:hypothetical protein
VSKFVTMIQRMFSGDSVAKSVVARDVVSLTSPTRHCLIVLRNAMKAEMSLKEKFRFPLFFLGVNCCRI